MTREEAIERLNIHKSTSVFVDSIAEAIDMAIEALSADTVSREAYHNLVTASNDIDRALREYQDKEENGELVSVVRCKDCRHGEHIQIPLWKNRDIDKAPSQFHDFVKCHKFHIKGVNETLYLGDDDYCSYGERKDK